VPIDVRPMTLKETDRVISYFHDASPEHLDALGVDPTRLPAANQWRAHYERLYEQPIERRSSFLLSWLVDGAFIGFSTADKILFGVQAHMHLHIIDPERRNGGLGVACVARSIELYFQTLQLRGLFCEPNAFNVAPNRTLQKAGFKYVKTYMTVPGPLNFRQAVNRWAFER
jgi:RimJ/RimL family protein N-acetyltransferase